MKILKPQLIGYNGYPILHATSKWMPLARFAARLRIINLMPCRVGYDYINWHVVYPFWRY